MIVLDTNVFSVLMGSPADVVAAAWVDRQPVSRLAISAVTLHEVRVGIAYLPPSRRRDALGHGLELALQRLSHQVLPIDEHTTSISARSMAARRAMGRPMLLADCLIAAAAIQHRARLATRNVRDFAGLPLDVVDPWSDVAPPG
ncbi:MAG: type II toxin-antitoxin system VapC family toxin [Hyphomicrobiaceae bacterium]|nr:type II toxin-antitoxin system VapC family toxin [Hyphomicrobiaceae bacterium]